MEIVLVSYICCYWHVLWNSIERSLIGKILNSFEQFVVHVFDFQCLGSDGVGGFDYM